MRMSLAFALVAIGVLAGCKAKPDGEARAPAATTAATPAPVADGDAPGAGVTMRYQCGGGNHVDVLGARVARVTLADGRVVEIPHLAGSTPPAFVGEALAFAVGDRGAQLSQDEVGHWDCTAS